jgi:hypothetical protein
MKLLIISEDAGAKIACGRGTGNYYIISDGLIARFQRRLASYKFVHAFSLRTGPLIIFNLYYDDGLIIAKRIQQCHNYNRSQVYTYLESRYVHGECAALLNVN